METCANKIFNYLYLHSFHVIINTLEFILSVIALLLATNWIPKVSTGQLLLFYVKFQMLKTSDFPPSYILC